ncbi:hypothetical protein Scep_016144 [Stephania cephalantha]|uniref:Uncharacterized protein n=1 Tax=Stephania cephalantha TaxID=152367 RepID=A0AAP0INS7_9MAGN
MRTIYTFLHIFVLRTSKSEEKHEALTIDYAGETLNSKFDPYGRPELIWD